jgi:DNA modification methylase
MYQVWNSDCREVLKGMEDNSIDTIVTDPPYGISFLQAKWDYDVPDADLWAEVCRVAKPGALLLSFFSTRTYHRGVTAIEDGGFEIRDQISWLYGSGFSKSSKLAEGIGTSLKPAHDPIVLARKPIEGTIKNTYAKWGTSGMNIDESRLESGRLPTNVILDEGSAQILDDKTPHTKSVKRKPEWNKKTETIRTYTPTQSDYGDHNTYEDSGGVSRFFYHAKVGKKERALGNEHPTAKPLGLMEYLVKMVTPEGGVVLDPFMGSGATGEACILNNFDFIGIEMDEDFFKYAFNRLEEAKCK